MIERREAGRTDLNAPQSVSIESKELQCILINISDEGALLRVSGGETQEISIDDLGKEAKLVVRQLSPVPREYKGEIIRYYQNNGNIYFAVRFWTGFRELR